jgi:predicted nucleic acid-binding protein
MKRSEIQETPGFRPEGLHPGYGVFVQLLSQTQVEAAIELFRNRPDKGWSFTDCSSFVLMREYNLQVALAVDGHFRQAGFLTQP